MLGIFNNACKLLSGNNRLQWEGNANGDREPNVNDITNVPEVFHCKMGLKDGEIVGKKVEVGNCMWEVASKRFNATNFGESVESCERDLDRTTECVGGSGRQVGEAGFGKGEKGVEKGEEDGVKKGGKLKVFI